MKRGQGSPGTSSATRFNVLSWGRVWRSFFGEAFASACQICQMRTSSPVLVSRCWGGASADTTVVGIPVVPQAKAPPEPPEEPGTAKSLG
jgi:hypothetical protein